MQMKFLKKAADMLNDGGILFVEENYYEGWGSSDITGKLVFFWTKMKFIQGVVRFLGANTAGEGVRFRSSQSWSKIFDQVGLNSISEFIHPTWGTKMPFFQKLLLMCAHRYQSMRILSK